MKVTKINVTNGGSGYTSPPKVNLSGGGGNGASGDSRISGGVVTSVAVVNGGDGYSSAPDITLSSGGGKDAVVVAEVS